MCRSKLHNESGETERSYANDKSAGCTGANTRMLLFNSSSNFFVASPHDNGVFFSGCQELKADREINPEG